MDLLIAFCTAASGLSSIIYVLDYFGFISISKGTTGAGGRRPSGAIVIVLLFLTWAVVGFDYYDRHSSSYPTSAQVLAGWGAVPPDTGCEAEIDGSKLSTWQDKFAVALVCGLNDASIDRFNDKRVTISSLYTIVSYTTEINTAYSKPMSEAMAEMKRRARRLSKHESVQLSVWYGVVLLPKGTAVADIVQLSDVSLHGGIILKGFTDTPQE